ncbi:beta strand repeat-containing protein, partial [Mannheimia indoligenes]
MNKIFKVIFNRTTQRMEVASELAKNQGKVSSTITSVEPSSSLGKTLKLSLLATVVGLVLSNSTSATVPVAQSGWSAGDYSTVILGETTDNSGPEGGARAYSGTNTYANVTAPNHHSVAIGGNTSIQSTAAAVVLGYGAKVEQGTGTEKTGSVALGAYSIAGTSNTGTESQRVTIGGVTYEFAGKATSDTSVLSVGSGQAVNAFVEGNRTSTRNGASSYWVDNTASTDRYTYRQIQNVAAGTISSSSTDAINGSQLYSVIAAVNAIANKVTTPAVIENYLHVNDGNNIGGNPATNLAGADKSGGATAMGAVAIGIATQATSQQATAVGSGAKASSGSATALGTNAEAKNVNTVALGVGAVASAVNAAALTANALASGNFSIAAGNQSTASGLSAVAVGSNTNATAESSVAVGANSTASKTSAVAVGNGANATENATVAIGRLATATKGSATAVGDSANATGNSSTAIGNGANANGTYAFAGAMNSSAAGGQSIAIGRDSLGKENHTIALGSVAKANTIGSIAMGKNSVAGAADLTGADNWANIIDPRTNRAFVSKDALVAFYEANKSNPANPVVRALIGKQNNIAIGDGAQAIGGRNISIGENAGINVRDQWNIHNVNIGSNAGEASTKDYSVAIGYEAGALKSEASKTAQASVLEDSKRSPSVYIGKEAGKDTAAYGGVGIGTGALKNVVDTNSTRNIAIGTSAGEAVKSNDGRNTTFPGFGAGANILVGDGAGQRLSGDGNAVMGNLAGRDTTGDNNILMGHLAGSTSTSDRSIIMGPQSGHNTANNTKNVLIGNFVNGGSDFNGKSISNAVGIGSEVVASGNQSIAIGQGSKATADQAIAIGTGNLVNAENAGAIGDPSIVSGAGSYTLGNDNAVGQTSTNTGAFGNNNQIGATATYDSAGKLQTTSGLAGTVDASGSRVVGNNNTVATKETFVVGNRVTETAENSVFLGSESAYTQKGTSTDGIGAVSNAVINTVTYSGFAGSTSTGVVSVGAPNAERRIQNVAAGLINATSTDAINGSQLYQVVNNGAWEVQASGNKLDDVKWGDKVNFISSDGSVEITGKASTTEQNTTEIDLKVKAADSSFLVQNNGDEKDRVNKDDIINFVNGGNTKAVVTNTDGKASNVTYHVTGLPVQFTDKNGNPVVKVGDQFFKVDADGNPTGDPIPADQLVINVTNPTAAPNAIGAATAINNVVSGLGTQTVNVNGPGTVAANTNTLLNLNNPAVHNNTVATVGDLRNMGWIVSASGNNYLDTVKNANQVNFIGDNGVTVTGSTSEEGIRDILVKGTKFETRKDGDSYTITITYPDGQTEDITIRDGRDGQDGAKGETGAAGRDGKDGV